MLLPSVVVLILLVVFGCRWSCGQQDPGGFKPGIKPSRCSLEYQTVYLNSDLARMNGRQLSPPIVYYPFCIRVPRCSGCCGSSVADYELRECVPDGIRYTSVVQTGQVIAVGNAAHHPNGNFGNGSSSLIQIRRRQKKVPIHTGCQCRCKLNPLGLCPSALHRFEPESCRCQCINRPANPDLACSQQLENIGSDGRLFWDENECRCRCRQYYASYLEMKPKPDPALFCPVAGLVFSEQFCRCVDIPQISANL